MALIANPGEKFIFNGDAFEGTAAHNTTTDIDFKVTKDSFYLNGASVLVQDGAFGDYVAFQIVDKDNILGYGANTVLNEFVKKWYLNVISFHDELVINHASSVPKNLYLRLKYTSISATTDPKVKINVHAYIKD